MELQFLPIILFLVLTEKSEAHQQLISLLPNAGLGQTVVSGPQFLTAQGSVQPSILQLVRQPQVSGLTQVVGQPGAYTQVLGQQGAYSQVLGQPGAYSQVIGGHPGLSQIQVLGGGVGVAGTGEVVGTPLVTSVNGLGLTSTATNLPYPYSTNLAGLSGLTTATNLNGVPILVPGQSGVNYVSNGLQTLATVPSTSIVQQPVVHLNPVVREVSEEDEENLALVHMDPMDAALKDMENKGQMHMEKYAWGRSSLSDAAVNGNTVENRERKADVPVYYTPLPTGGYAAPHVVANRNVPSPSRSKNPFIGEGGKRKKHFELYQYFRNLDMNPQQIYVPMTVVPPSPSSPSSPTA